MHSPRRQASRAAEVAANARRRSPAEEPRREVAQSRQERHVTRKRADARQRTATTPLRRAAAAAAGIRQSQEQVGSDEEEDKFDDDDFDDFDEGGFDEGGFDEGGFDDDDDEEELEDVGALVPEQRVSWQQQHARASERPASAPTTITRAPSWSVAIRSESLDKLRMRQRRPRPQTRQAPSWSVAVAPESLEALRSQTPPRPSTSPPASPLAVLKRRAALNHSRRRAMRLGQSLEAQGEGGGMVDLQPPRATGAGGVEGARTGAGPRQYLRRQTTRSSVVSRPVPISHVQSRTDSGHVRRSMPTSLRARDVAQLHEADELMDAMRGPSMAVPTRRPATAVPRVSAREPSVHLQGAAEAAWEARARAPSATRYNREAALWSEVARAVRTGGAALVDVPRIPVSTAEARLHSESSSTDARRHYQQLCDAWHM